MIIKAKIQIDKYLRKYDIKSIWIRLTSPSPNPSIPAPKTKTIKKSDMTVTPQLLKSSVIQNPIRINFNIISTVVHLKN